MIQLSDLWDIDVMAFAGAMTWAALSSFDVAPFAELADVKTAGGFALVAITRFAFRAGKRRPDDAST